MKVLFVCLGNICRSPTAEGTMRRLVEDQGLAGRVEQPVVRSLLACVEAAEVGRVGEGLDRIVILADDEPV